MKSLTYVNVFMTCQVMWTDSFELGCGFPVISALMRTVYKSKADSGFYSANPYLMIDEVSQ